MPLSTTLAWLHTFRGLACNVTTFQPTAKIVKRGIHLTILLELCNQMSLIISGLLSTQCSITVRLKVLLSKEWVGLLSRKCYRKMTTMSGFNLVDLCLLLILKCYGTVASFHPLYFNCFDKHPHNAESSNRVIFCLHIASSPRT
jgi:hypothetical protein